MFDILFFRNVPSQAFIQRTSPGGAERNPLGSESLENLRTVNYRIEFFSLQQQDNEVKALYIVRIT